MKDENLNQCTPFQRAVISKILDLSKNASFSVVDVGLMGLRRVMFICL